MGSHPPWATAGQGTCCRVVSATLTPKRPHFPHGPCERGIGAVLLFPGSLRRKSLSTIEGPPTIKGPLYLILPQKYCHKIKYETSHSRQTVLDSPRPALHIAAGRGNNKGRKGRQASRVGHAHGIQLTPTRSPMLRSQYAPYSHRNNFRDGAARHGGRTTRREAET
ncbi:hypothetical protein JTE90_009978 [Oedothorax gibbosus]|uniref:Ribosomal protein L2 n=1 Tax=Oedothorax gibbosus TaxID=931172 RepID=A0AAV6TEW8_9ARAC|nr:hypothetical protein JTE90_009978 [Oedothorax gibbosus]